MMRFSIVFALLPLVAAIPTKRVDNRQYIHLQLGSDNGQQLCAGLADASATSFSAATCGAGGYGDSDITELVVLYGVGKSSPLEITSHGCPTSTGASLTGGSNVPVVDCDIDDQAQFFTVQEDGTVTNDATGTCLTLGKAAPGAPLTLSSCGGDFADKQTFTWSSAV
ncbi:unnamed protein product [Peniophora sp. CBMAI 1063]|nr:unnamed protein product [Peniophora sp. CBMAI 1063]